MAKVADTWRDEKCQPLLQSTTLPCDQWREVEIFVNIPLPTTEYFLHINHKY